MRRPLALWLIVASLACGCTAGASAPAALAAGSPGVTVGSTALTATTPLSGASSPGQPSFGVTSGGAATTPQIQTIVPSTTTSSTTGGLSTLDAVVIAIVAVLLLGGIAFWIWYDARHAARSAGQGGDPLFGQRAHAGSKAPRRPRKHKPAERRRRKRGRAR